MAKKALLLDKSMLAATPSQPASKPQADPEPRRREPRDYGEPLNFRVPPEFSERVRLTAVRKKMKLHQLLVAAFEVYWREEGEGIDRSPNR